MSRPARVFPVRPHDQTTPTPRCIFFYFPFTGPVRLIIFLVRFCEKYTRKTTTTPPPNADIRVPPPPVLHRFSSLSGRKKIYGRVSVRRNGSKGNGKKKTRGRGRHDCQYRAPFVCRLCLRASARTFPSTDRRDRRRHRSRAVERIVTPGGRGKGHKTVSASGHVAPGPALSRLAAALSRVPGVRHGSPPGRRRRHRQ